MNLRLDDLDEDELENSADLFGNIHVDDPNMKGRRQTHFEEENLSVPMGKKELMLNQSAKSIGTISVELGSQVIKVAREGYEIGTTGMKDMATGQMIVGNLTEEDLEYGDESTVLGMGASGYVYLATHKRTG